MNRKVKQFLSEDWYQWEGADIRKEYKKVNIMEYYVLMYENGKMRPVEIIPGMQEEETKENDGGGEFNYYIVHKF
jgi:hypothetical protein